jgi:hypothetical protein
VDLAITVMNVTNQNQGNNDTLSIVQNKDGSYTIDWDPQDPMWSWLNNLTSKELQIIIQQAIRDYTADK